MIKYHFFCFMLVLGLLSPMAQAQAQTERDKQAEVLINNLMTALLVEDFDASIKAAMPYLHKSLLNDLGTDISADLKAFSFKKAHDGAKNYAVPVKISRVRETTTTAIGFGPTAQEGQVVDYFIDKKAGTTGMPAPVKVFFPKDGSAAMISYVGSI